MTITQWLHSVWFIAPLVILSIFLTVDKFFTVKVNIKHRPKPKGGFTYNDSSLVNNKELDKFWGSNPVPAGDDPDEWRDFFLDND